MLKFLTQGSCQATPHWKTWGTFIYGRTRSLYLDTSLSVLHKFKQRHILQEVQQGNLIASCKLSPALEKLEPYSGKSVVLWCIVEPG